MAKISGSSRATDLIRQVTESTAVALNIQYIQKDILEIKQSIKEIAGLYVRTVDFAEHVKIDEDREVRIRVLERNMWKWIGVASVGGAVIATLVSLGLKFLG